MKTVNEAKCDLRRIEKNKTTKKRCEDDRIQEVVNFIFRDDNIQMLSWGTKPLFVDGEWVSFPSILRRMEAFPMWHKYSKEIILNGNGKKPICTILFMESVRMLTSGIEGRKSCVDYHLGGLI